MRRAFAAIGTLACCLAAPAAAQVDCFPSDDSNEARLFAAFSVALAFGLVEAPDQMAPGTIRAGLELTYLPNIDEETRTPTVCRPGKGPENTDLLLAFPRPRVTVALPAGFIAEASWVPPVRLNGIKANLLGLALLRSMQLGHSGTHLALRLHGTLGVIRAPITCNDDALEDASSECFDGTRSDDAYHPNIVGAEALLGWSLGGGRLRPFAGAGLNLLYPRFRVNFINRFDQLDDSRVEVDLKQGALFGGATWAATPRVDLSAVLYAVPGDEVTGRLMVSYGMGAR